MSSACDEYIHTCALHQPPSLSELMTVQVWVSDTWKFIYMRQPKSSSSAVIGSIKSQLCKGYCRRGDLYPETDMGSLALIWDSYFVFTFVRNPWTRALSAYSMFSRGVLHTCAPLLRCASPELCPSSAHDEHWPCSRPRSSPVPVAKNESLHCCLSTACMTSCVGHLVRPSEDHMKPNCRQCAPSGCKPAHACARSYRSLWKVPATCRLTPGVPQIPPTERCGIDFLDFTEDVYRMRTICETQQCCSYVKPIKAFKPGFVDAHISDHAHCMFLPDGDPIVDYIGASEAFDDAWADVVAEINRRVGTTFVARKAKKMNSKASGGVDATATQAAGCGGEHALLYLNATTATNIAQQFALDVVRLGFA